MARSHPPLAREEEEVERRPLQATRAARCGCLPSNWLVVLVARRDGSAPSRDNRTLKGDDSSKAKRQALSKLAAAATTHRYNAHDSFGSEDAATGVMAVMRSDRRRRVDTAMTAMVATCNTTVRTPVNAVNDWAIECCATSRHKTHA